jgi:hypothetical protein
LVAQEEENSKGRRDGIGEEMGGLYGEKKVMVTDIC